MDILDLDLKSPKDWVSDSQRQKCLTCSRKFTTFVRKHHCRACGEVICSHCSTHRLVRDLTKRASVPPRTVRLCNDCISPILLDDSTLRSVGSLSLVNSYQADREAARVQALHSYAILDTPPDHEFDAICRAVATTFDASVAAIGFLDATRQWYKASIGIQPTQLPREIALCAHLLERPFHTPLVVLDTRRDTRFMQNPLVAGAANVRFYAGVAIVNHEGHMLGSIMVLDCKPRESVDTAVTDMLLHLAKIVMDMLEDRRAREQKRLSMIEEASEIGSDAMAVVGTMHHSTLSRSRATNRRQDNVSLATPPDSFPKEPWSSTSSVLSSLVTASKAKSLERESNSARSKFMSGGSSSGAGGHLSGKSEAETACLDLLCRVTDTQQMLAQQQTIIFERLTQHSARMDSMEASMRSLQVAFHELASRLREGSENNVASSSTSSIVLGDLDFGAFLGIFKFALRCALKRWLSDFSGNERDWWSICRSEEFCLAMVRYTHEQMKKMTRRVINESTECQTEFLAFITAMAKSDWEITQCRREFRDITKCMAGLKAKTSGKQKPTLNHLVLRAYNKSK
ncbi:hypothetical protein LEN26_010754 [Aphanomyces euteiches]|nr:hypothetical protein AeMF1_015806 [Aphanomyces euteiches]KAH9121274.1 hypothetical protein LEN26_010754 [Aphanomyces euteiches]KAH9192222.1 hypothetical protein AeNC1_005799 [Aphanomyces euteiches]